MTNSRTTECRIVIDTLLFVPAMAHQEEESRVYALLLRKCCKVVVSTQIAEQYQSVMNEFGYPGALVHLELSRLQTMNKLRNCDESPDNVSDDLAPRKDRHIVAPCLRGYAKWVISSDRGIRARRTNIREQTGAEVLDLQEAESRFGAKADCPPDVAGER
jgi:predicted nucleic acid-binding protein